MTIDNLFEQTKELRGPLGPRISGDPEVLHEVRDWIGNGMSRAQIKKILEYVPEVFPYDWKSPEGFDELNDKEKEAYKEIAKIGPFEMPGPVIQRVIKSGVEYHKKYSQVKIQSNK